MESFVLWFSVFVRGGDERFDVMLNTLTTYSKLPFEKVYLNILLDEPLRNRKKEIDELISTQFNCAVDYEEDRYALKEQLINRFNTVSKDMDDKGLIFFCQNDDHPFIDINNDILEEGVAHMMNDDHDYKSLFFSHWPEIVKLSLKQKEDEQIGNFIKFNGILTDSIQVFNVKYLREILQNFIIDDLSEYKHAAYRIDEAASVSNLFNGEKGVMAHIYAPLRELCVHFDGYQHVHIPLSIYPCLKLPFEENNFDFSRKELENRMAAVHDGWNTKNTGGKILYQDPVEPVPQKYIDTMLKCYGKL